MRAERDRRAAILTAEGVKQSQILTAEGEKQSAILEGGGRQDSAVLRAEGESKAIETVFQAIHEGRPDPELLSYQYLQMLPRIAEGSREQDLGDPVRADPGAGHAGAAPHPVRRAARARAGRPAGRRRPPTGAPADDGPGGPGGPARARAPSSSADAPPGPAR